MSSITNTTKADIHVSTGAGDFVFKAGETLTLAADRIALIEDKGAVYFSVGELVSDAANQASEVQVVTETVKTVIKSKK